MQLLNIIPIVNELSLIIIKNRYISPTYRLMQAHDEMQPSRSMLLENFTTRGNGYARATLDPRSELCY